MQQPTFFDLLYGDRQGYAELAYIVGDPSVPNTHTTRAGFYRWPDQAAQLQRQAASLSASYGDVYISSTLYATPSRDNPQPTNLVVIDDAPASPPAGQPAYSFAVQTSRQRWHAYYLLDSVPDNATRAELSRRASAALAGDPSGADLKQLVRVPGSYNTKGGQRWPVQLHTPQGGPQAYSIAALAASWPAVQRQVVGTGWLDWQEVTGVAVGRLLDNTGIPRRLAPTARARAILASKQPPADTSAARYAVGYGLALHGYEPHVIAAILFELCDYGASITKGASWLALDCERITGRVIDRLGAKYRPTAERPYRAAPQAGQVAAAPAASPQPPATPGRPARATALDYLRYLVGRIDASNVVLASKSEIASETGLSLSTITRYERTLKAAGVVQRQQVGQAGLLILDMAQARAFAGGDLSTKEADLRGVIIAKKARKKARQRPTVQPNYDTPYSRIAEPKAGDLANEKRPIGVHTPTSTPTLQPVGGQPAAPAPAAPAPATLADVTPVAPAPATPALAGRGGVYSSIQGGPGGQPVSQPVSQSASPLQPASLRDMVRAAMAAIPTQYERINTATGELLAGRITGKRVIAYVRALDTAGRYSDRAILALWHNERDRLARLTSPFARARQEAARASLANVRARAKSTAGAYVAALRKQAKGIAQPRIGYLETMASIWAQEEAKRDRSIQHDWELRELADLALAEMRKAASAPASKPARAARASKPAATCGPVAVPASAPATTCQPGTIDKSPVMGLVARLRQRLASQGGQPVGVCTPQPGG